MAGNPPVNRRLTVVLLVFVEDAARISL